MSELIISVSGLRGVVGENLTPDVAARFACAYAAGQPAGPLVLARDGRNTGRMLADTIRGALLAAGRSVLDAEVAATPTVGVLVRDRAAAGAIQVTASHNPPQYNGIKLFSPDRTVLSAEEGEQVVARFQAGRVDWVDLPARGSGSRRSRTRRIATSNCCWPRSIPRPIRQRRFGVLLDSNHGSGSVLGQRLLKALGCRVTVLGGQPDGLFAPSAGTDGRESGRRLPGNRDGPGRHRFLPGSRCRSAGGDR